MSNDTSIPGSGELVRQVEQLVKDFEASGHAILVVWGRLDSAGYIIAGPIESAPAVISAARMALEEAGT